MKQLDEILLEYYYSESAEDTVRNAISALEQEIGGKHRPYVARFGAIDLLSWLELVVGFTFAITIRPWLSKYFEGLLNADRMKEMGEQHRTALQGWLVRVKSDLSRVVTATQTVLRSGCPSLLYRGRELSLTLVIPLPRAKCYVVLNHSAMSARLAASLPAGVMRVLEFATEGKLPDDAPVFQLYFDQPTDKWKYLFAPTNAGILNWIVRVIDLETGSIEAIPSREAFAERFRPAQEDVWKFIVSPFRRDPSLGL